MSTYEPGTVAVATVRGVPNLRVMRTTGTAGGDDIWLTVEHVGGWRTHIATDVTDIRPLVMLDLDDPDAYGCSAVVHDPAKIVSALRETNSVAAHAIARQIEAQTKPPRIPEPGLWGVVEAGSNAHPTRRKWVRYGMGWRDLTGNPQQWSDLIDPTLVRPGVEDES